MALIDVSELMSDPDFIDDFQIVRRSATVNNYGENEITENTINANGSIQSGNGDTLKRLPDGVQLSDVVTIYSNFPIYAERKDNYADIVIICGERYQVVLVTPWRNWGTGYNRIDAVMEKPNNTQGA